MNYLTTRKYKRTSNAYYGEVNLKKLYSDLTTIR